MKIVCAASVLHAAQAFGDFGEVQILPDRDIQREDLLDATALIIRSKTRVTRALLENTSVGFVATATAGADHMDTDWMSRAGIVWTAASGCNANAVAEYTATALALLAAHADSPLPGKTLGIVGLGHVGSLVQQKAAALGLRVLCNDPPKALKDSNASLLSLDELLPQADILTFHVPLTTEGPFATRHLIGCRLLGRLKPGAWLINTSRGAVAETDALQLALAHRHLSACILDVWEGEPGNLSETLDRALLIRTPHIAGYTLEGLLNGTLHCRRELCHYLEIQPAPPVALPDWPAPPVLHLAAEGLSDTEVLSAVLSKACPLPSDSAAWRACARTAVTDDDLRQRFDAFRKAYTVRREFAAHRLQLSGAPAATIDLLAALNFQIHA